MKEYIKQSDTEVKIVETKETIISLKDLYSERDKWNTEILSIQGVCQQRIDKIKEEHLNDINAKITEAEKLGIIDEVKVEINNNEEFKDKP